MGSPDAVVARYRSDVAGSEVTDTGASRGVRVLEEGRRWGTGDVEILSVVLSSSGRELRLIPTGAPCTVHVRLSRSATGGRLRLRHRLAEDDGTHVGGHNTDMDGLEPRRLGVDGEMRCRV